MREIMAEAQPFVRDEIAGRRGPRGVRRPPLQARDHRRRGRRPDVGDLGVRARCAPTRTRRPRPKADPPFPGYPGFIDLCRGPHVPDTGATSGTSSSCGWPAPTGGATRSNPMLQRIYGTAWASKKATSRRTSHRLEEAAKRDHRKLGVELDLFSLPRGDRLGPGRVPPQGRHRPQDHGGLLAGSATRRPATSSSTRPTSPRRSCSRPRATSTGYADGMYPPMDFDDEAGDGQDYYLKPMNCPFHILIYRSRQRSLPRAAAAALRVRHGLPLREVRRGARPHPGPGLHPGRRPHLHARKEQMADEIGSLLDFVLDLLRDYGLDDFYLELSTTPAGEGGRLRRGVGRGHRGPAPGGRRPRTSSYVLDEGGGAFYGPKISVQAPRRHRSHLADVDHPARLQLPQRFGLEYVGADGERHRPIMIHRALFGSIERFFGVLARALRRRLPGVAGAGAGAGAARPRRPRRLRRPGRRPADGRRASAPTWSRPTRSSGDRIRKAKLEKMPYILVVGDDDVEPRHGRGEPAGRRGRARRPRRRASPSALAAEVGGQERLMAARPPLGRGGGRAYIDSVDRQPHACRARRRRPAGRSSSGSSPARRAPTRRPTSCGGADAASPSSTPTRTRPAT